MQFRIKLKNLDATFSNDELEEGLRISLLDFISERLEIYQLMTVIERLRNDYDKQLSQKFLAAIDKLHELNEILNDPKKERPSNEKLIFFIDDILDSLNTVAL